MDSDGQVHGTFFDDIVYDPNPPTGTVTVDGPGGQVVRVVSDPTVELYLDAVDDNSGIWEMQLSESADFGDAAWEPFTAFRSWTASSGDGAKTVYARFRDRATNESVAVSDQFIVDTTAPAGELAVAGPAAGLGVISVTLTITAVDDLSSVSEMRVSHSAAFSDTVWMTYRPNAALPFEYRGVVRPVVYAQFRDELGNESTVYTTTYPVDITPPIGVARVEPGTGTTRSVTFGALDYGSGVSEIWLSPDYFFLDDLTVISYTTAISWDFAQLPVVYVMFVDGVGNSGERISAVLYDAGVDDSPPTFSNPAPADAWDGQAFTFTLTITDPSGVRDTAGVTESVYLEWDTDGEFDQDVAGRLDLDAAGGDVFRADAPAGPLPACTAVSWRVWAEDDDVTPAGAWSAIYQTAIYLFGDFDHDDDVDIVDIMGAAARWGSAVGEPAYDPLYDLDNDGDIDIVDIMQAAAHWGESCE